MFGIGDARFGFGLVCSFGGGALGQKDLTP